MPKQYVKLRVGLLDHLPAFAESPDAFLVYGYCLLQAPMSGPEAGCVRINQTELAESWGWTRVRATRALRWLQVKPTPHHPLLILVEKGARGRPGRYVIPRFETAENKGRFSSQGTQNPPSFCSDSVSQVNRIASFCSDSVSPVNRNSNKERARSERRFLRTKRGADAVYEKAEWITVRTEAEAREALLKIRGYAQLPDDLQDRALQTAMKNLEFFKIRFAPDETEEGAA